jgi:cytochrome c biogenesis protein CcmG/thiol:disulfide interchange protein DsbE
MRRLLGLMLVLMVALPLATAGCQNGRDSAQVARVGRPAPEFTLPALDGQTVSLGDLRGRPVVVNFWATWCGPCVHEMPYIQETYEVWSEKGLVILAININESPSQVQGFMQENRLSLPVLLDGGGEVAEQYGVRAIPTTIFIDVEGITRNIKQGSYPSRAAIEADLKKIVP